MNDFHVLNLVTEIATQLDGTVMGPEHSGGDLFTIALANERAGLRVIIRRGIGVERTRFRASMSLQALKGPHDDFREMPAVHELSTAAAMSRGARIIAAQIETKIVQPAMPMLETWKAKREAKEVAAAKLAATVERYQTAFPGARIEVTADRFNASLYMSTANGGYVQGRLYDDGNFHIDRSSSFSEAHALAILALISEPGK